MKLWSAGLVAAVVLVGSMDVKAQTVKSLSRDVEALREDLEVLQRQAYRQQNSGNVAGASSDNVQQRLSQYQAEWTSWSINLNRWMNALSC